MIEKEVCPQICKSQVWFRISSTGLSVIYHDQMHMMEQAATNILTTIFSFNEAFWPELASPWGDHHSKSLQEDQLTRGLRPWALALTSKSRLLSLWVIRNLVLSKHNHGRSIVTFVDISLQGKFKHEHWYRAKSKLHWNRPNICSAAESSGSLWALASGWVLYLPVCQRQPTWKSHFSWRVTRKGDFFLHCQWRDRQLELDTSWY